ncbi:N-chimaerin-like isoform X2 [Dysidea avara]|uniref:N-chimaerin-like isoform X2 n=1 Tax=Dysidea avara TaxID=196820 RepID=UPI00333434E5
MTARLGLLNNQREYGVNDIGVVLSPSAAQDEVFSLLDIEDVLDPPDLDADVVDGSDMTDSTVSEDEEDYINCWNPYLYQLQQQAPRPRCVPCRDPNVHPPPIYGREYHGCITREEACHILGTQDGNYLVRAGLKTPGTYSLSFVFNQRVRHYHLYHDGNHHFVGEKLFDNVEDVVADGLITLYMEKHNADNYLQRQRSSIISSLGSTQNGSVKQQKPLPKLPSGFIDNDLNKDTRCALTPIVEQEFNFDDNSRSQLPIANGYNADPTMSIMPRNDLPGHNDPVNSPEDSLVSESHTPSLVKQSVLDTGTLFFNYKKPHNFKVHNFIGMVWCDLCKNFMWGLRAQGYKCVDCGYNIHKQCQEEVEPNCQPVKHKVKRIYGVDLTTHVKLCSIKLPLVLRQCVMEVESRGMTTEGIYRISGHAQDTMTIKEKFDKGVEPQLSAYDVHAVSSALKLYLRELPIPLISYEAYDLCLIATML